VSDPRKHRVRDFNSHLFPSLKRGVCVKGWTRRASFAEPFLAFHFVLNIFLFLVGTVFLF